jgi:UDP-N-acetylglucosamine 2-epimerase (non-hydrolysing)
MRSRPDEFDTRVCVTAQHRHLLDQVLTAFEIVPHHDLDLMRPRQTLFQSTAAVLLALEPVIASEQPDMVVVQGDTTTTFSTSLASFYLQVPVAHVEAGLRTGNLRHPFPEEMNRLLTTRLAALHFAPTQAAAANLSREGVCEASIFITGNTAIDAILHVVAGLESGAIPSPDWPWLDPRRKLLLVTAHRRESFGSGMERLCRALAALSDRPDVQIAYPVHPNPNVIEPVRRMLSGRRNVELLEPLTYIRFVDLMRRCTLLLTDSGGVQEEAPSLGKPVLVLRETTERQEAVDAGTAVLVGTDPETIINETSNLLDDPVCHARRSAIHNVFGDGRAAARISDIILSFQAK